MEKDKLERIRDVIKGDCPMALWQTNVDCQNLDDFEKWLASRAKEALEMQLHIEQKPGFSFKEDNDSHTHAAAKAGAFLGALYTFRRARAMQQAEGSADAS